MIRPLTPLNNQKGLLIAAILFLCWLGFLAWLLQWPLTTVPWPCVVLAIALQTSLQTSLFITGHDAMHGVLVPAFPRLNHRLGAITLTLYAGLNYQTCRHNHRLHHQLTASSRDPDFAHNNRTGIMGWYLQFMGCYLSWLQLGRLGLIWILALLLCTRTEQGSWLNCLTFCVLPLWLSSLQLFVFGTYLPHRMQQGPHHQAHPQSLNLPSWLSLLACFHFGYHREHHDNPGLAWFDLPGQRHQ